MKEKEQKEILQKHLSELGLGQMTDIGIDRDRSVNAIKPSSPPNLPLALPVMLNTVTETHTNIPVSQATAEQVTQGNASLLLELDQMKEACASLQGLYEGLKLEKDAFEKRLVHANEELEEVLISKSVAQTLLPRSIFQIYSKLRTEFTFFQLLIFLQFVSISFVIPNN